jgi:hypothetical protein
MFLLCTLNILLYFNLKYKYFFLIVDKTIFSKYLTNSLFMLLILHVVSSLF